nr:MAG: hypothetical protein [Microvirus sp.]
MKRRPISKYKSRKMFRKGTRINNVNSLNPRKFRGGIRL